MLFVTGKLQVNMSGFHLSDVKDYTSLDSVVGFSIDKTVSDALNPYVQATETQCILNKTLKDTDKAGIVRFILNFKEGVTTIKCSKNVRSITILDSPSKEAESVGALSDAGLFKSISQSAKREKRNLKDSSIEGFFASPLDREIDEHYEKEKEDTENSKPLTTASQKTVNVSKSDTKQVEEEISLDEKPVSKVHPSPPALDSCEDNKIPLKVDKNTGYYETSFVIYISDAKLEGLYSMFFHNCFNYLHQKSSDKKAVDFTILIEEKNSDSYLSAGEMPLPALYQMLSILFFLSGCFWVFILKKNGTEQVFRIHWIMAALVFLKSLSLFFHGVNYNKIATNGKTADLDSILLTHYNIKEFTWSPGQFFTISLTFSKVVCSSSQLVGI